jgi:hypothetical protein
MAIPLWAKSDRVLNTFQRVSTVNLMLGKRSYFICAWSSIPAILGLMPRPPRVWVNRFNVSVASSSFFVEFPLCGTLLEVVNAKKGIGESETPFYFRQMFSAVRHLHCTISWCITI